MMKIWVLGFFPDFFDAFMKVGVVGQALSSKREISCPIDFNFVSVYDYGAKGHKDIDASPYGGGAGMVLRADTLKAALLDGVVAAGHYGPAWREKLHIIHPCARGKSWDQYQAKSFFNERPEKDLVFICGRYEGIDERFLQTYVDEYLSLGPYIISGGELAVMAFLDSAMRFIPGVLGNDQSACDESYQENLLEYPHYTKPREFEEMGVPPVLLSGDHKKIQQYREREKVRITKKYRPDLWDCHEKS